MMSRVAAALLATGLPCKYTRFTRTRRFREPFGRRYGEEQSVRHIRQISAVPASAFEVQPSIFLRVLDLVLQRVVIAQLQQKKTDGSSK